VAIVSGASSGIGRATARELGARGAAVVLTARNGRALQEVASEITRAGGSATVIVADMTVPEQVRELVRSAVATLGRIDIVVATAYSDIDPEEVARRISIHSGVAFCEHAGHKINIVDTPGYEDFVGDVLLALDVVEGAIITLRADAGVEVGTDRVWGFLHEHKLPALFVANRMDKEHANFDTCIEHLHEHFGAGVHAMQVPIGAGDSFRVQVGQANSVQQVRLEVEQAYSNMIEAAERIVTAQLTVRQAEENLEIANGRYTAGVGNPIEVTDALVAVSVAKISYISALTDYKTAQASLEKAMGIK